VAAFKPEDAGDCRVLAPTEGAARLLRTLPVESWAVATSGPRIVATERLQQAGLPLPPVLVCAEDVLHGKPSPDVYLMAAAALAVSPHECIVIEDAPPGIEAARAAGMSVIALTTTHRRSELAADACATSLAGIHVGRIDHTPRGSRYVELLVVDS
jgi:sugar-phosphatase